MHDYSTYYVVRPTPTPVYTPRELHFVLKTANQIRVFHDMLHCAQAIFTTPLTEQEIQTFRGFMGHIPSHIPNLSVAIVSLLNDEWATLSGLLLQQLSNLVDDDPEPPTITPHPVVYRLLTTHVVVQLPITSKAQAVALTTLLGWGERVSKAVYIAQVSNSCNTIVQHMTLEDIATTHAELTAAQPFSNLLRELFVD